MTETIASSNGTNTPNIGPDVFVASGFGQTGPADTELREAALKARALKRAEKRDENHRLATDLSKSGDDLLELGDYAGACANYLHATRLWPSNDQTYLKLTEAYLKCELYSEATKAATRGLSFNPKSLEQRYLRGVARLQQNLLDAARADFNTVLAQDPKHANAKSKLEYVAAQLKDSSPARQDNIMPTDVAPAAQEPPSTSRISLDAGAPLSEIDFNFPKYEDDRLEIASLSDSSEANHYGNGIPCRFYNHTGCVKGQQCEFSHAPDEKSVRDGLGRNVCIYFLLDACKFGTPKCVYSHSRENLPMDDKSWWNDENRRLKVKSVLEMAEAQIHAKKIEFKQEQKQKQKAAKKAKKKKSAEKALAQGQPSDEAQKAAEPALENKDETATKEQQRTAKSKKTAKKANAKKAEGGQDATAAETVSEHTISAPDASHGEDEKSKPQEAKDGKKKSGRKRVWKKRSKKEVGTNPTDAPVADSETKKDTNEKD